MSTSTHSTTEISAPSHSSIAIPRAGTMGKVVLATFTLLAAGVMIFAIIWLQELPIRRAEKLLTEGLKGQEIAISEGRTPDLSPIREAYHTISQYLETHPRNSRGLALQARILFHVGRPEEAIEIFERVGPDTLEELQDYARCYVALENFSRALPLMEQVLREDPTYSDALYEASTCRVKLGRFQEALETAKRFAAQPGNEAKGNLLVASIQTELKNRSAAIEAFSKVLEFEPDAERLGIPPWQFFFLFGGIYGENGQPAEALPLLERSLELERHPDTYTKIGESHMALAEGQKAEAAWRMAVSFSPNYGPALEHLANVELSRENAAAALTWLEPLKTNVSSSNVAYAFQRAYTMQGNTEEAETWKTKADQLRKGETLVQVINNVLTNQPESLWGLALRAHRMAAQGDWGRAQETFKVLQLDAKSDQFLKELAVALEQKRDDLLPRLELLPIDLE